MESTCYRGVRGFSLRFVEGIKTLGLVADAACQLVHWSACTWTTSDDFGSRQFSSLALRPGDALLEVKLLLVGVRIDGLQLAANLAP